MYAPQQSMARSGLKSHKESTLASSPLHSRCNQREGGVGSKEELLSRNICVQCHGFVPVFYKNPWGSSSFLFHSNQAEGSASDTKRSCHNPTNHIFEFQSSNIGEPQSRVSHFMYAPQQSMARSGLKSHKESTLASSPRPHISASG